MELWKKTIESANRCFEAGRMIEAREGYLQALAMAQMLFDRWHDADQAAAALVVSLHNLADLHLRLGQVQEAGRCLRNAHERLLDAAQSGRSSVALREAALRHSNHTYLALMQFMAQHGHGATDGELLLAASTPQNPAGVPASRQQH
ncbi:hypothetical protein [Stutzerimonas kirkiae]|uniref:Tetratricopeptide repeat protein n=1 Tax=Stutzerimonas kirkiae TaxID=2211392 RepID=A0A4Q9RDG0_9GAMM|nr:hypothetical protein [Stutzerimonas kirkiae]TBU98174.1 hypothetical protein DNJ96_07035 [Stutzerimonas kirkiae]TBV02311.1 hypothetical protein DNJ95_09395 [Stutzerimonas kirkiae]TBV11225.1 hypothetical protein DNK08_04650 [Stutzerimonas kirkiae]TBV14622.1 hypothetical protein DNK01_08675 [Stutzerimonas kirkiae]